MSRLNYQSTKLKAEADYQAYGKKCRQRSESTGKNSMNNKPLKYRITNTPEGSILHLGLL